MGILMPKLPRRLMRMCSSTRWMTLHTTKLPISKADTDLTVASSRSVSTRPIVADEGVRREAVSREDDV